jgi:Tol biopolymer transport system component
VARASDQATDDVASAEAATITAAGQKTVAGALLGTAAYMAPEQARGEEVDARADIWSLGCVLHEMLTGRALFAEPTVSDTIAAVMTRDPDWEALPAAVPDGALRLLRRCLARDPRERLHHAADVRIELDEALAEPDATTPAGDGPRRAPSRLPWILAVAAGLLAAVILGRDLLVGKPPPPPPVRALIDPPAGESFVLHPSRPGPVTISPDGRLLAYTASAGATDPSLWIRPLNATEARRLPGTEGARYPCWSPDGDRLAFFADGELKAIAVDGGPAVTLAEAPGGLGASWSASSGILFACYGTRVLQLLPPEGGAPTPVTVIDEERGERRHIHPHFLPDGRRFLFVSRGHRSDFVDGHRIMLGSLDDDEVRDLMETRTDAQYAHGHLWYGERGVLFARPFDPDAARFTGPAIPVADGMTHSGWAAWVAIGYFAVSKAGVVAYHQGNPVSESILSWYDRDGHRLGDVGEPQFQYHPNLSPDGRYAALQVEDQDDVTWALWICDLARGLRSRFTMHPSPSALPVWSRDGRRIAFSNTRKGWLDVYVKPVAGGEVTSLDLVDPGLDGPDDLRSAFPLDWTPDDRFLVVAGSTGRGDEDLRIVSLREGSLRPIRSSPYDEEDAAVSPDGRWLAYIADERGHFEVYVTDFPAGEHRWQVSTRGGIRPEWNPDGHELFFLGPGDTLMAATVDGAKDDFEIGPVQPLFPIEGRRYLTAEPGAYAVGTTGDRFLVNRLVGTGPDAPIALLVGWPEELGREE